MAEVIKLGANATVDPAQYIGEVARMPVAMPGSTAMRESIPVVGKYARRSDWHMNNANLLPNRGKGDLLPGVESDTKVQNVKKPYRNAKAKR